MPARIRFAFASIMSFAFMGAVEAQAPPTPAGQDGVEVLARGPIHEAFATTMEASPSGTPIVPKPAPENIEEMPPDQKPAGDNVQWIPGYWHWDEDRADFIWISGFWRVPPPGRTWLPGSWHQVQGGSQWVPGFWQPNAPAAAPAASQVNYLPPPPAPIEIQPSTPAPSDTYTYVPGSWIYNNGRYAWRPGYWIDHRPGWIWVPAHYRWSPAGYVFIDGYWDYPLADRGVLFAPVAFTGGVYLQPRYVYAPTIVVSEPCLYTSLFIRRGWGCYYFGDYFEPRYATIGFNPWCGSIRTGGFSLTVGFGRGAYDPMWDYYRVGYRSDPAWIAGVNTVFIGRFNGTVARPPVSLTMQSRVVNNTIINVNVTNVTNVQTNMTMLTTINHIQTTDNKLVLKPITRDDQVHEMRAAAETRTMAVQRREMEKQIAARGPMRPNDPPRSVKLDLPKTVQVRAQIAEEKKAAVPPHASTIANQPATAHPTAPAAPVVPKPGTPAPPVAPKVDPKAPAPKVDPKSPMPKEPGKPGLLPGLLPHGTPPKDPSKPKEGEGREREDPKGDPRKP